MVRADSRGRAAAGSRTRADRVQRNRCSRSMYCIEVAAWTGWVLVTTGEVVVVDVGVGVVVGVDVVEGC